MSKQYHDNKKLYPHIHTTYTSRVINRGVDRFKREHPNLDYLFVIAGDLCHWMFKTADDLKIFKVWAACMKIKDNGMRLTGRNRDEDYFDCIYCGRKIDMPKYTRPQDIPHNCKEKAA